MTEPHPTVRAVVGTAGHVDHGKTTLVRHLTGVDTDRLHEEKERGISIELGFAPLDLDGDRVAIVDVPGHERFVRQMIAGAAGIDVVLLVVAADEGVMPQTREHLDICELLGVKIGAVVVSKTDLVDEDWLELVEDDVATAVEGTFLDGAPIVRWAAGDPAADARVKATLATLFAALGPAGALGRDADRPFKLSIDRAFTMRGFGTIVTGTTASGTVAVGDSVALQPSDRVARVRGIQMHGAAVDRVGPGARAALNLQGIDADEVHRSDVVTTPGALLATPMFDATFLALRRLEEPVADRTKVLVHVGTAQVEGTIALIGVDAVAPGDRASAQIRLAHPLAILPGEPYVVRGFSVLPGYGKTIGGGRALAPDAHRHRRTSARAGEVLSALAGDDVGAAVEGWVDLADQAGRARARLACELPWTEGTLRRAVDALIAAGRIAERGGTLWSRGTLLGLVERARNILQAFHAERPSRPGLHDEELRSQIRGDLPGDLFAATVDLGVADGSLGRSGDYLCVAGFTPKLSTAQQEARGRVRDTLAASGLMPPRVQDLPEVVGLSADAVGDAIWGLVEDGEAVRVNRELVYLKAPLDALEARIRAHFAGHETLDTATFKDLTGTTRKWTIPLSEYFDRVRVTLRVGDVRRLRGS
ncbi:MAG: selenocysteine-specific translation elongation factor [Deltaproteobacteria bacterium]|nr:MAG: selenocysteine-specific translation elongation factor [Deltaproteobacteria bacterium]